LFLFESASISFRAAKSVEAMRCAETQVAEYDDFYSAANEGRTIRFAGFDATHRAFT